MAHSRRSFLELSKMGIMVVPAAAYNDKDGFIFASGIAVVPHLEELAKLQSPSVGGNSLAVALGAQHPFDGLGGLFFYDPKNEYTEFAKTPQASMGAARNWRRVSASTPAALTARDFGATGDISTDDTRALQELIEQAGTYAGDLGKAGYIPAGLYRLNRSLTPQSYSRLHGDGPHQSVLYNFQHPMPTMPAILAPDALTFSTFEKFGMQSQRSGFDVGGTTDHNTFRDLKIFGMSDAGFRFRGPLMTSSFERILFENCNYGLVCENLVVNRNTLREPEFKDCANSALKINGAEDLLIIGGRFEGRGSRGRSVIEVRNVHLMTFMGGYFEGSHEYALRATDSDGVISFESVHFTYFRKGEAYRWEVDDGARLVFRNCHSSIPMRVPSSSILEGYNHNFFV